MSIPYLDLSRDRRHGASQNQQFFRECCRRNVPYITAHRAGRQRWASVKCDLISTEGAVSLTPEAEAAIENLWHSLPNPTRANESHSFTVGLASWYSHVPLDRVESVLQSLAKIVESNIQMFTFGDDRRSKS